MIFKIYRTSDYYFPTENKPCKKAYIVSHENGEFEWNVEINTLEDLIELQKEVAQDIIFESYCHKPFIEIYDYCRERGG